MGKKVKKKARSVQKEKRALVASPKDASQTSIAATETGCDKSVAPKDRNICPHLGKGTDLNKISAKLSSSEPIRCEDCREDAVDRRTTRGKGKQGKKKGGVDYKPESKAIWICLECGHFSCGGSGFPTMPQSHAVRHARQSRHPLAIQFENPQLRWCFPCNTLIPAEKSENDSEQKDLFHEIVKMIKGHPLEGSNVDVEDVWFGSGSVTSGIKSEGSLACGLDGTAGYSIRGLVNLGNTCFFNSILQNLLAMDNLRDYFLKLDEPIGPLTSAFRKIFTETNSEAGARNVLNPRTFFGSICAKAPQFRGYQQQDSHELLRCLLDGLSTEELSRRKQTLSSQEDHKSSNVDSTFVDAIFGGQLSSTVSCLECGHPSVVYEPFLDLSLPVPTKKPPSRKAQPVSRAKKPKPPPKRSGRVRPKVSRDADSLLTQSASALSISGKFTNDVQSSAPNSEENEVSSSCSALLGSTDASDTADNEGLAARNISSAQASEHEQTVDNVAGMSAAAADFTWMDYIEPETELNHNNVALQLDENSGNQGFVCENLRQDDILCRDTLKSSEKIILQSTGATPTLGIEAQVTISDNHDMNLKFCEESLLESSETKDAILSDINLGHRAEDHIGSKNLNAGADSTLRFHEAEMPTQVKETEVLLLPYKEETPTTVEMLIGEGDISLPAVDYQQDSLDFDGFGNLFNEPQPAVGPSVKPLSTGSTSEVNEFVEAGFGVGNISESDPDEVDNTDAPVSVESCLAYFTKPEVLSKNEHSWHCENCSKILKQQRVGLRKKLEKHAAVIAMNGVEDENPSGHLHLSKTRSFATEASNCNRSMEKDESGNFNDVLMLHNGRVRGDEIDLFGKIQRGKQNPAAHQSKDGKAVIEDSSADPSSSSYETCRQTSFSGQESDSCSVNEPGSAGETLIIQPAESLLMTEKCESEGSADEMDSKNTKVKRDASKRILINKTPRILTIHLKRFSQDARGRLTKLNGHVNFGETIDLRPFRDPRCTEDRNNKYRLVGVVEHLGTMRGGHYVAYVRGGARSTGKPENEGGDFVWYHASDAYVREVSFSEVLRCEAYILFYEEI